MPSVLLIQPTSGAPEYLSAEAWSALTGARAFCAPGDPLGARIRENDHVVTELTEAAFVHPRPERDISGGLAGRNLLVDHAHAPVSEGARALAARLAALAAEHDRIAFIVNDPSVIRAMFTRALDGDVDVEVVIGPAPRGHTLLDLVRVMARLRGPDGCPWDAEQTHQTLAKHLLEETYELLEAIESGTDADIAEELGDVLLQVVFHAQMGTDAGTFDIDDVANALTEKLVRRHPHVFGDVEVTGAREVVANWDEIKQHEKQRERPDEGIPAALPALAYAQKLLRRAKVEHDLPGALARARAQLDSLEGAPRAEPEELVGALLTAVVALARDLDVDAETALRRAARALAESVSNTGGTDGRP